MRIPNRYSLLAACLGFFAVVAGTAAPARAQEDPSNYPSRPIRLVVGFAAGGGNDIIARVVGQKLAESLGQPVIVENKPGGGAIIATDYVAKSASDGYTLLLSASGISVNPALYDKLPYDAVKDFVAVSQLSTFPLIMIVGANSPIKSVSELVAYAKANPDKTNYSSSSASFQLVTELFKQKTGAPMQAITYKSANESVLAVISGQVTTTIADAGPVVQQVKSGTARALAVATAKRLDDLPDVPTLKEAGADVEAVLWNGILVPRGTPPAIVKKLEGEFMRIAKLPDVIARLKPLGIDTTGTSSEDFAKIISSETALWAAVAKAANFKMQQ
jgi:tripartite-type tricarboxylate transporter receptor subunit TctC